MKADGDIVRLVLLGDRDVCRAGGRGMSAGLGHGPAIVATITSLRRRSGSISPVVHRLSTLRNPAADSKHSHSETHHSHWLAGAGPGRPRYG